MAIGCDASSNYVGRNVVLEVVESCGDTAPDTLTYLPIGSVNQKDINVGTTTTDITSDDTTGAQATLVSFLTFTASVSGFATQSDGVAANQALLKKYLVDEVVAGRQPTVFVRAIFPDVTYYAFCNLTSNSNSASSSEATGYTFEFSLTATPVGSGVDALYCVDTPA